MDHDTHLLPAPRFDGPPWVTLVCETCPAVLIEPVPHISHTDYDRAEAAHRGV